MGLRGVNLGLGLGLGLGLDLLRLGLELRLLDRLHLGFDLLLWCCLRLRMLSPGLGLRLLLALLLNLRDRFGSALYRHRLSGRALHNCLLNSVLLGHRLAGLLARHRLLNRCLVRRSRLGCHLSRNSLKRLLRRCLLNGHLAAARLLESGGFLRSGRHTVKF